MTREEIEAMPFHKKLEKLKRGIVIPPPDRYSNRSRALTEEEVYEIATLYNTRSAFQYGDPTAYHWAWRKGRLDEFCEHMERAKMGPKSCAE